MAKYYANVLSQGFHVVVRDAKGEPIPVLDANGNPKYNGNKKVVQTKHCRFEALIYRTKDDPTGYKSVYTTGQDPDLKEKDEVEILEKLVADGRCPVMSEKQYKQKYRAVETAKEDAAESKAEADKWKAEAEKLKAEIESLREKRGPGRPPKTEEVKA